ncbi:MAG: hypothetical protein ACPGUC_00605 [Gammaproteobacteria bacterium]
MNLVSQIAHVLDTDETEVIRAAYTSQFGTPPRYGELREAVNGLHNGGPPPPWLHQFARQTLRRYAA